MLKLFGKFLGIFILTVTIPVAVWSAGFLIFSSFIYLMKAPDPEVTAKAAIVLTGGSNRVSKGLDLLAEKRISELLVSGVHKDVEIRDLMVQWGKKKSAPPCCITLGREAGNTIGNALEAKKWISHIDTTTVFLITANYHMPRSLLEFKHVIPGLKIIPYPVRPENFSPRENIFWRTSFVEYHKLLMTIYRILVYPSETKPYPKGLSRS